MKNRILIALMLLFFLPSCALAQFKAGESFIDGGFSTNLQNFGRDAEPSVSNSYNHNLNVAFGKFRKANKSSGWGISNSFSRTRYNESLRRDPSMALSAGVNRFVEYYKSLNDQFALFVRPSVGLNYTFGDMFQTSDGINTYGTKSHAIMLGLSISGGIVWRVSPRWALYGNVGFVNPFNVSYRMEESIARTPDNPATDNTRIKSRGIEYAFSPVLSSGTIGLGFRYLWGGR